MIYFFIGTKAQFIKMAPVMVELQLREIPFRYIDSGQHGEFTRSLRQVFGIKKPDYSFSKNGLDITSIASAIQWATRLVSDSILRKKWLREIVFPEDGICLVHGDTISTLLGLQMAMTAGVTVGHVEAGLRSYNFLHPFPEELIRIYCMYRCDVLFTPSDNAMNNLHRMKVRGKVIHTWGNTVVDALRFVENLPVTVDIPCESFALAACHRLETIANRNRLEKVILLLNRVAENMKVLFVAHKPTRRYLMRYNLYNKLSRQVEILEMQDYINFAALIRNAQMIFTDGGSIQEECCYLSKPCLILRNKTERPDGVGKNAMLWEFKASVLEDFLIMAKGFKSVMYEWSEPSKQIVDFLATFSQNKKKVPQF